MASEYLNSFKDFLEAFDAAFYQIKKDTIEKHRRKWDSLYAYNQSQGLGQLNPDGMVTQNKNPFYGRKVTLEDIPVAFDRIPNPFDK